MWICKKCNTEYTDDALDTTMEYNDWGQKEYVPTYKCCCGGEIVEGIECEICGDLYADDDLYLGRYCKSCMHKIATNNVYLTISFAKSMVECDELNELYERVFSKSTIDHILSTYLVCTKSYKEVRDKIVEFVDDYGYDFAEYLSDIDIEGLKKCARK